MNLINTLKKLKAKISLPNSNQKEHHVNRIRTQRPDVAGGGLISLNDINENTHTIALAVAMGVEINAVVGNKLSSDDFFLLANLLEDYPELLKIYTHKTSPEYSSSKINKNLMFINEGNTAKIIENSSNMVLDAYDKVFDEYVEESKSATPTLLRNLGFEKIKIEHGADHLEKTI